MSRITMYVNNDCTRDSRVLREAASLASVGHEVTIMARWTPGDLPEEERRSGFRIVRVRTPTEWAATWKTRLAWLRYPWRARREVASAVRADLRRGRRGWLRNALRAVALVPGLGWTAYRLVDFVVLRDRGYSPRAGGGLDHLVRWEQGTLGWARAAGDAAPPTDVHHGHDLPGLGAAFAGRARRGGRVVYDSHEIYLESGSVALRPRWVRAWMRRTERRWTREIEALVTVNDALAAQLVARYGVRDVVVVHNCLPRWTPAASAGEPDLLRSAMGVPPGTPVALYHGALLPHRGIEQFLAALESDRLGDVHGAVLGYGSARPTVEAAIAASPAGARLHLLDAVDPDDLPDWIRTADVGVMPIQPSTLNHVLSTPNKLFECLAVGVPVVASDFDGMRRIVMEDPDGSLGAVCDPTDPAAIARAIQALFSLPPDERDRLRARVLEAAHRTWNWESESAKLVALYERLAPTEPARPSALDATA